ncbi:patatin-like phospholipase family protein [Amycolatopsis antarctica]|uniref:patatin-like phospholipase family protein n=1 Tax=Amycolatopsis antarctica TaxID=1854586 RepID=UPI0010552202|nr:patatin-like phospholipase family protein [Amycolatopsis antarctica]
MAADADPRTRVRELGLDDPARYTGTLDAESLRWTPAEAENRAHSDHVRYTEYAGRSCDLTMRGGTTSGVIYPLAVCSLAEHYVFRSIGGASAGAIAAAATAAAEYGRLAETPGRTEPGTEAPGQTEQPPEPAAPRRSGEADDSVRPGFAGLAQLVDWLVSGTGDGRWRLAQLFQPSENLHRVYRLATALMQKPATTGRNTYLAVLAALLMAVTAPARAALVVLFAVWFAGPLGVHLALPPQRWNEVPWPIAVILAALALTAAGWVTRLAVSRLRRAGLAPALPLLPWLAGLLIWAGSAATAGTVPAWLVAVSAGLFSWLLLTFAALAAYAAIYGKACWPVLADAERFGFGLVPGAAPYVPSRVDRLAGMPASTGVPPLAVWLADRIDDLAGTAPGPDRRALTFGDLWLGPDVARDGENAGERLRRAAADSAERVINLALMTTDLSGGRPYRLPFEGTEEDDSRWQFCHRCLDGVLPARVVTQLCEAGTAATPCPRHPDTTLHWMPGPWDVPVILGARMSLSLPGLIQAVPLCRKGKLHWFSDGGITSNFPIHFFDTLLPRWPTFGLNLDRLDSDVPPEQEVHIAPQDSTVVAEPWSPTGAGIAAFGSRIIGTFLGWRDTMQSALPGFRGRIASVRQGLGEGGTNLFMTPESIARLALRGHKAGETLKQRFSVAGTGGESPGLTQTDRYRWIRMRIAIREFRELARQAQFRSPLYQDRTSTYLIPRELSGWFAEDDGVWPKREPYEEQINEAFTGLGDLANVQLAQPFDGTSPVNPVFRLTPPE